MSPIQTNFGTLVATELIRSKLSLKDQLIWLEGVKFIVQLFANVDYSIPKEFYAKTFKMILEDIQELKGESV